MPPRPVTPLGVAADRLTRVRAGLADLDRSTDEQESAVLADLDHALQIVAGLESYVERVTSPASEPLTRLAERTAAQDWSAMHSDTGVAPLEQEMLSGHLEGRFLEFLVHVSRADRVLEIGMFTGYSALAMAEGVGAAGRVVACELDSRVAALARRLIDASPVGHRVEIEVGPALDTLAALAARREVFDLVFLDADKPGYVDYLDALLDGPLLAAHGFVVVDNTLMQGEPWSATCPSVNGRAIAAFNDRVAADPRLVQVVVPLRDGVTLLRRA